MSETKAEAVTEMTLHAVITRCGCGDPDSHRGKPCYKPRAKEDLGEIASSGSMKVTSGVPGDS